MKTATVIAGLSIMALVAGCCCSCTKCNAEDQSAAPVAAVQPANAEHSSAAKDNAQNSGWVVVELVEADEIVTCPACGSKLAVKAGKACDKDKCPKDMKKHWKKDGKDCGKNKADCPKAKTACPMMNSGSGTMMTPATSGSGM